MCVKKVPQGKSVKDAEGDALMNTVAGVNNQLNEESNKLIAALQEEVKALSAFAKTGFTRLGIKM